jgi:hypothetical protein
LRVFFLGKTKHSVKKYLLLISILSWTQFVLGQKDILIDVHSRSLLVGDSLMVFERDSIKIFDAQDLSLMVSKPLIIEGEDIISIYEFLPVVLPKGIYFVHTIGGLVLEFDGNQTLRRIDNSFNHRMWIRSSVFTKGDTIYRFGGYGFWSLRNFIAYYDWNSKEWEVLLAKASDENPPGMMSAQVYPENEMVYFVGGVTMTYDLLERSEFVTDIYRFNMNERSWKRMPSLLEKNPDILNLDRKQIGDEILFMLASRMLINVKENNIKKFAVNSFNNHIKFDSPIIPYKDALILFKIVPHSSEYIKIVKVSKKSFYGEFLEVSPLFKKEIPHWIHLFWLLLLIPFYRYWKKSKKGKEVEWTSLLSLNEGALIYRGKEFPISLQESKILHQLLSHEEVDSTDILNIVENPEHNYSHNMRVRNQVMEDLNFKLKTILNTKKELISSYKSKTDKRIKVYRLEKKL